MLGPQIVREILFHALHGGGLALLAMASRHSQVSQIARVLRIMEQRFTENLTVEELAGGGKHERLGLPPPLQGGHRHLAPAVYQDPCACTGRG